MSAFNGYEVILIFGTLISLLFAAAVVVFAQFYQNRLMKHRHELQQQEELKKLQLMQAVAQGQETENRRVAMELHDSLAPGIATVKLRLGMHKQQLLDSGFPPTELEEMNQLMKGMIDEVRLLSHALLPENIEKRGLRAVLKEWLQLVQKGHSLKVVFSVDEDWPALEAHRELLIFRMVQELVQNALKHAEAAELRIQLHRPQQQWTITISDNGKGFDTNNSKASDGIGLQTLQQRATMAQVQFHLQSQTGAGTTASITVL